MQALVLALLGLLAGSAHGVFEAFAGTLGGLGAGLWIASRTSARERLIDDKLRDLDRKTRWLYEAQKEGNASTERPHPAGEQVSAADTEGSAAATTPDLLEMPEMPHAAESRAAGAVPSPARPPATPERDAVALADTAPPWLASLWSRLMGSNPLARIGIVVLFFGVASAMRLAVQAGWLPPALRLAGTVFAGLALIAGGLRMATRGAEGQRLMFALTIQGGGFALLYLAVYFALARYHFLEATPAFLLFAALGVACAVTAARQSSQALALLGLSGAFVAPMLASTGGNDYMLLFSYFLLLDAFIIALSWRRAWRALVLAGFLFTFAIGTGWGLHGYTPDDYPVVQAFLIAFFLLFTASHVAQTTVHAPGGASWESGALLFGPPLAAGVLQMALVQPFAHGGALSAAAAGIYYLLLARVLARRAPEADLLRRAHAGIGAALLTLAVPLALDLQMTAALYAVEGAAAVWYGCARKARLSLWSGLLLQGAAGLYLIDALPLPAGQWPLLNGRSLGGLLLAGAALWSVRVLRRSDVARPDWLLPLLTLWLAGWWLFGGLADIDDFVPLHLQPACALLFVMASCTVAQWLGRRHAFAFARALAALSLPVLWLGSAFAWDAHHHLLYGAMVLVLPLAWATHFRMLRQQDEDGDALFNPFRHIAGAWTLMLSIGVEAGRWLDDVLPDPALWQWLAWTAIWLLAARIVQRGLQSTAEWPWGVTPDGWRRAVLRPAAALTLLTVLTLQFAHDGASALPYLPLLSVLDLGSLIALAWLARSALLPPVVVGIGALTWVSALAARSVHHLAGVAWSASAMFQSTLLQAVLSLTWALTALALMMHATRHGARSLWFAGFGLLGAVGGKMLMVDLAGAGTLEWTGSLLGIGVLILIASYVAPVPPAAPPVSEDLR
ncbi:DUF2339 domain-containing protein [Methyloversatilis thermotolerans]|uniref:DUF2339 domain-containing protein n=1 Tax=Methyloversatilis thermotolerans TaxID=1346290 RepID=UPI0003A5A973|nr:DUF2339 domain-containing protein [Methyloversatilis thermotolerans]